MASKRKITRREFNAGAIGAVSLVGMASDLPAQQETQFDLVVLGGRVMDPETGYDQIANVGVSNGRITAITQEKITGAREINATNLVVAPGFIDTHFHWPRPMGNKLALRDGRTTVMDLEMGTLGTHVADWYASREGKNPRERDHNAADHPRGENCQ